MGIPSADFGPFLVFLCILSGGVGAIAFALFLFVPLPWSFYLGLAFGVLLSVAARLAWLWFIAGDLF